MKYFPVYHFVVNNYGYGDRTDLFIVARNYQEAFDYVNDDDNTMDWDYCDENSSDTGWVKALESDEHLPYEDERI